MEHYKSWIERARSSLEISKIAALFRGCRFPQRCSQKAAGCSMPRSDIVEAIIPHERFGGAKPR